MIAGVHLPCHKSLDYEDADWEKQWERGEKGKLCAGALTFLSNNMIVPRDRGLPVLPKSSSVFSSAQAFIDHHRQGPRSWSDREDELGREAWAFFKQRPFAALALAHIHSISKEDKEDS